jgi:hypothetical protein
MCDGAISVETGYGMSLRRTGVQVLVDQESSLLLFGPGTHPASYAMGAGVFPQGQSGRCLKLTTHLQL